jgi:hypothetical protein
VFGFNRWRDRVFGGECSGEVYGSEGFGEEDEGLVDLSVYEYEYFYYDREAFCFFHGGYSRFPLGIESVYGKQIHNLLKR